MGLCLSFQAVFERHMEREAMELYLLMSATWNVASSSKEEQSGIQHCFCCYLLLLFLERTAAISRKNGFCF